MVAAKIRDTGPLFEVRRDFDCGPKTLRRGSRVSLAELERLAPSKVGPLRRTGMIRPVGGTDRSELQETRSDRHGRRVEANRAEVALLRAGGTSE